MSIDPIGDDLAGFLALAMSDPPAAARRLSAWCDARSPEFGSILSDDAGALDDFADGDADMADWLAVMARKRPYPLAVRLGLAAVVAGHRASRGCASDPSGAMRLRG